MVELNGLDLGGHSTRLHGRQRSESLSRGWTCWVWPESLLQAVAQAQGRQLNEIVTACGGCERAEDANGDALRPPVC